jgi:AraC-like DNA-binding protein
MFDTIYNYSLIVAWAVLFIFAVVLFFGKVPESDAYKSYDRTRKILSVALFLWGVQVILQWVFNLREETPNIATALNISCYYMGALLFGMAYISLLDSKYISKNQKRCDFVKWSIVSVSVWCAVLFLHGIWMYVVLIAAAAFFFFDASRIAYIFYQTYRKASCEIDNYYSENTDAFIRWIYHSTFGIVFFGLVGAFMAFAPKWAVGLYMWAGIVMFVYIFLSLLNYSLNCEKVSVAVSEALPNPIQREVKILPDDYIHKKLEEWVKNGYYRGQGVTMGQLTEYLGINRNTLSEYFNQTLNISFREWINDLRMAYAKRLLINKDITIEQIAEIVGVSSKSYFCTLFKQREGITPSQWRQQQEL